MKITRRPSSVLPDETLLAVHPTLSPFADAAWYKHAHYFTGRAVSHLALAGDQDERGGRLATLGQALAHGVVQGLEVELGGDPSQPELRVAAGSGVAISGEDVVLARELRIRLASVPVWPGGTLQPLGQFGVEVLALAPVIEERTTGADPADPCELDPSNYSYEDRVQVDAARLWRVPVDLGVLPNARWRNLLAHAAFGLEVNRPVWMLPWLAVGVPIALAAWAPGQPPFVDHFAVARSGGRPRPARALVRGAGRAPLWRARVEQFVAELAGLDLRQLQQQGLASRFHFLPPVAVLPADALTVRSAGALPSSDLFPPTWHVRALPVELEALDDVYRSSVALDSLDLDGLEQIDVVVPVPGTWFDPRLLVIETLDPEFDDAIYRFRTRLFRYVQARGGPTVLNTARRHDFAIQRFLTGKDKTYPANVDPVPLENQPPTKPPGVPVEAFSVTVEDLSTRLREELTTLQTTLIGDVGTAAQLAALIARLGSPTLPPPLDATRPFADEMGGLGLDGFIARLRERIERADDRLDANFLRMHADVYRIRQHIAGNTAGTQLATSPALADIARKVVAAPTTVSVRQFADAIKRAAEPERSDTPPPPPPPPKPSVAIWSRVTVAETAAESSSLSRQISRSRPISGDLFADLIGGPDRPLEDSPPPALTYQKTIRQRFATPPAPESHRFAIESKVGALRAIADTHELYGLDLTDLVLPGFRQSGAPVTRKLGELLENGRALIAQVASGAHDAALGDDEAAFFSAGASTLEDTVALMRILEARLALLRRVLERCVAARERIGELARRAGLELERMEDGIAEGRHDVRVAELLKTEEVARLAALNARRDEIVAKHVPYLVLRRSRVFGEGAPLPGYALEPGTVADPVPACLEGEFEAPDQLRELVDLFSDAPVGWFPQVRAALDRLNRIDALNQTLQHAVIRARLEPPVLRAPFAVAAVAATPFGQRIQRVFTARHEAVRKERTRVAALDPARVVQATWAGARRDAERVVSIGDLIDAKHGRQDASRAAAAELENLYRVSACLFGRFRDVNPALRLLWAERYSQFDAPPDLRRLSGLERFDELPREDRRELQLLVDWLFQRVDGGIDDAVALMNDLVRVALLLASHAPVNQILEADVAPDQTAGVGGTLRVNVDIARVRIGMHVALFGSTPGQIVARGVVSDVGSGGASVRVLSANAVQVSPLRAQLSEPSRHAAALGPRAVSVGPAGIFEVEGR